MHNSICIGKWRGYSRNNDVIEKRKNEASNFESVRHRHCRGNFIKRRLMSSTFEMTPIHLTKLQAS